MNETQLAAQLRAAAWALVALVGANRAIEWLQKVINEIRDDQWNGPGNR